MNDITLYITYCFRYYSAVRKQTCMGNDSTNQDVHSTLHSLYDPVCTRTQKDLILLQGGFFGLKKGFRTIHKQTQSTISILAIVNRPKKKISSNYTPPLPKMIKFTFAPIQQPPKLTIHAADPYDSPRRVNI
jgi:hypothetical protein